MMLTAATLHNSTMVFEELLDAWLAKYVSSRLVMSGGTTFTKRSCTWVVLWSVSPT